MKSTHFETVLPVFAVIVATPSCDRCLRKFPTPGKDYAINHLPRINDSVRSTSDAVPSATCQRTYCLTVAVLPMATMPDGFVETSMLPVVQPERARKLELSAESSTEIVAVSPAIPE